MTDNEARVEAIRDVRCGDDLNDDGFDLSALLMDRFGQIHGKENISANALRVERTLQRIVAADPATRQLAELQAENAKLLEAANIVAALAQGAETLLAEKIKLLAECAKDIRQAIRIIDNSQAREVSGLRNGLSTILTRIGEQHG